MEKTKAQKERSLVVVKRNELVQKSRFELNLTQQKTLMYLISKINPMKDETFTELEVDINDLCDVMGINNSGKNYKDLKNALQSLRDKSMWVEDDTTITLMAWLSRVTINKGSSTVLVVFDELMAPYLLQIRERFTQYRLENVLPMKNKYSPRLYELLKSHENERVWEVHLDELKKLLFILPGQYEVWRDFNKDVLQKAITEICNFSDLAVAYETKRKNRKVDLITFHMCNVIEEDWREGKRREMNRDGILDNGKARAVAPKKIPTVQEIWEMQKRKAIAKKKEENQNFVFDNQIGFFG